MKTILYVEETQNAFISAIIKRQDVRIILLRFSNCMFFSREHIKATNHIPTFIIDKDAPEEKEVERLNRFLRTVGGHVDFFYNDSEFNQVYIQRIALALHLPGALTELQATTVRDKYLMKRFIRSIGWNCPDFTLLHSRQDAIACAQRWGFPFIVKWRCGVSSIEVYEVCSLAELDHLQLDYHSGRYMAESYQPEKIWCIDAIVQNGMVVTNLYTWLPYTNLSFAEKKTRFVQLGVGRAQDCWQFDPHKLTQDIVDGLALSSGYLHLEAFVTDGGKPSVCEFAWRTPGDHMLQNHSVIFGTSIENYLLDALLGLPVEPLLDSSDCVADVFLPLKTGTIKKVSGLQELQQKCSILAGEVFYQIGDTITTKRKYTDSGGWVQLKASSIADMMNQIDKVYQTFELEVEGG